MVIRLKSVTLSVSVEEKPPKGVSKGDVYRARTRLLNIVPQFGKGAGVAVGSDYSILTVTSSTTAVVSGVATLPGGTLQLKGAGRLGSHQPIPVVGGTGRFSGARGTLVSRSGQLNTFRLTLP